jgi:hypothetical protein
MGRIIDQRQFQAKKKDRAFLPSPCFHYQILVGGAGFEPATPAV